MHGWIDRWMDRWTNTVSGQVDSTIRNDKQMDKRTVTIHPANINNNPRRTQNIARYFIQL